MPRANNTVFGELYVSIEMNFSSVTGSDVGLQCFAGRRTSDL